MKKYTKNRIFGAILSVLTVGLMASCSDWTEVESLDLKKSDIADQNPELYAKYLQSLRDYKNSDHTLVYAWFDNSNKKPFSRAHHITNLPDSVDFVGLMHPDNLAAWELEDMDKVRKEKGTKVIYSVDFDAIKASYNAKLELATEEEPVAVDFIGFMTDSLEHSLSLAKKFNYDGICITYNGKATIHLRPNELKEYTENETAFIGIIRDWYKRTPNMLMVFEGKPQNVIDSSLFDNCVSLLLSGKKATNMDLFTYTLKMSIEEGVPTDRLGMVVMATDLNDPNKTIGYFTDGSFAMDKLALWAPASYDGIKVKAVGVYNASTDYYTPGKDYYYMRKLISSVNPSVK